MNDFVVIMDRLLFELTSFHSNYTAVTAATVDSVEIDIVLFLSLLPVCVMIIIIINKNKRLVGILLSRLPVGYVNQKLFCDVFISFHTCGDDWRSSTVCFYDVMMDYYMTSLCRSSSCE